MTRLLPAGNNGGMQIVVGVNENPQSQDALALAIALATATDATLVIANIYPIAYDYPSAAHVDAEWRAYLVEQANATLAWASEQLPAGVEAASVIHPHRSSGVGLIEVAQARAADMIVIGSAPGGLEDHIQGGSTSDQLLHGSPVPVAMAPLGYRSWAPQEIGRALVAYQHGEDSESMLASTVAALSRRQRKVSDHLELLSLSDPLPHRLRETLAANDRDDLAAQLNAHAHSSLASGEAFIHQATGTTEPIKSTVLSADNVVRSLAKFDWHDDDVLVIGSRRTGPIRRVFLGDMTYKLIRAATVPVIVMPRSG